MKKPLHKLDKVVFMQHYFSNDAEILQWGKNLINTLVNKRSVESCIIISVAHILETMVKNGIDELPGYLVDSPKKFVKINDIELVNSKYE